MSNPNTFWESQYRTSPNFNYDRAKELFAAAKNKEIGKPLCRNTRLMKRDDDFAVCFHGTDVVTIHPDNTYTLNSSGYRTATTKSRINEFSPVRLCQGNNIWWLSSSEGDVIFYDGIKVNSSGIPIGESIVDKKIFIRCQRKLTRMIGKYIKGWISHLQSIDTLPVASAGDCWYCYFIITEGKNAGREIGFDNPIHLIHHMEDEYFVPSLLYNAIKERATMPEYADNSVYSTAPAEQRLTIARNNWEMLSQNVYNKRIRNDEFLVVTSLRRYFNKRRQGMLDVLYNQEINKNA